MFACFCASLPSVVERFLHGTLAGPLATRLPQKDRGISVENECSQNNDVVCHVSSDVGVTRWQYARDTIGPTSGFSKVDWLV